MTCYHLVFGDKLREYEDGCNHNNNVKILDFIGQISSKTINRSYRVIEDEKVMILRDMNIQMDKVI